MSRQIKPRSPATVATGCAGAYLAGRDLRAGVVAEGRQAIPVFCFSRLIIAATEQNLLELSEESHNNTLASNVLFFDQTRESPLMVSSPRFRVRTVMILVAAVAITIASWNAMIGTYERYLEYSKLATFYKQLVSVDELFLEAEAKSDKNLQGRTAGAKPGENMRRRAAYHTALARKYARGARSPWFALEPNPPGPR